MSNKEFILKFIDEVFNAWDTSKLDDYMRDDYIQHNPTVENGKEGFKKFCEHFFLGHPHMHVKQIFENEEKNTVAVFFECTFDVGSAKVCDIYRIENGKLAEHWDILQRIDPDEVPVNDNGHF